MFRKLCRAPEQGRAAYPTMLKTHFAHTCDILHRNVTGLAEFANRESQHTPDPRIRVVAQWQPKSKAAYSKIKRLYSKLRFDRDNNGSWIDVPVRIKTTSRQKVSRHQDAGAPTVEPHHPFDHDETIT